MLYKHTFNCVEVKLKVKPQRFLNRLVQSKSFFQDLMKEWRSKQFWWTDNDQQFEEYKIVMDANKNHLLNSLDFETKSYIMEKAWKKTKLLCVKFAVKILKCLRQD